MNARDLSEPPNGTTSGCPPPSQHHNYRGLLHTQQRNHFGGLPTDCFRAGVAQITRRCDCTFLASLCFKLRFFDSLNLAQDRRTRGSDARFSPVARGFAANRTAKTAFAHPKIARYDRLIVPPSTVEPAHVALSSVNSIAPRGEWLDIRATAFKRRCRREPQGAFATARAR